MAIGTTPTVTPDPSWLRDEAPTPSATLGSTNQPASMSPAPNFELTFRREVARLVSDILKRNYVTDHLAAVKEAHRRGTSVEHIVAAAIAYQVMKKVDEEYL